MRKIAGRIMVDMGDFSASIEFDDWIAELSPIERAKAGGEDARLSATRGVFVGVEMRNEAA